MVNPEIHNFGDPNYKRELNIQDEILDMSPKELVDHLTALEEKGTLDAFLYDALENDSLKAMISYWEKWLSKEQQNLVEKIIEEKKKIYPENSESLPLELEKKFSQEELELIFSNLGAIQLTYGCSKGCPFCGLDAAQGVREYIPYSQLANLFQKYGKYIGISKPTLYWASEPSDYMDKIGIENKTYQDIHELAIEYGNYNPHITSKNVDSGWLEYLVGIQKSKDRVNKKVKNRISAYGLKDENIESVVEITKGNLVILGQGEKHTKGMGKSFFEESEKVPGEYGIGCFDGIILTPRGLYNVMQAPISERYPQGQIIIPIENLNNVEIKVGDSIEKVLRNAVVNYRRTFEEKILSIPLQIQIGGKEYSIALDKDMRITALRQVESDDERGILDKELDNAYKKACEKYNTSPEESNIRDELVEELLSKRTALYKSYYERQADVIKANTVRYERIFYYYDFPVETFVEIRKSENGYYLIVAPDSYKKSYQPIYAATKISDKSAELLALLEITGDNIVSDSNPQIEQLGEVGSRILLRDAIQKIGNINFRLKKGEV